MSAPWQWWVGGALAALAGLWMLARNLSALRQSRAMLDGRRARLLARVAWMTSVFAAWTGPLVGGFALVGVVLGLVARREPANPRTRLAASMAIENGVVLALAASALVGMLFWGG